MRSRFVTGATMVPDDICRLLSIRVLVRRESKHVVRYWLAAVWTSELERKFRIELGSVRLLLSAQFEVNST